MAVATAIALSVTLAGNAPTAQAQGNETPTISISIPLPQSGVVLDNGVYYVEEGTDLAVTYTADRAVTGGFFIQQILSPVAGSPSITTGTGADRDVCGRAQGSMDECTTAYQENSPSIDSDDPSALIGSNLMFPSGNSPSFTGIIRILDDSEDDDGEQFRISIERLISTGAVFNTDATSTPGGADTPLIEIGTPPLPPPVLSIDRVILAATRLEGGMVIDTPVDHTALPEGNSGSTQYAFVVVLDRGTSSEVVFEYTLEPISSQLRDTASGNEPRDWSIDRTSFVSAVGGVAFGRNVTLTRITAFTIYGDTIDEGTEQFRIRLVRHSSASADDYTISPTMGSVIVSIIDDDDPPAPPTPPPTTTPMPTTPTPTTPPTTGGGGTVGGGGVPGGPMLTPFVDLTPRPLAPIITDPPGEVPETIRGTQSVIRPSQSSRVEQAGTNLVIPIGAYTDAFYGVQVTTATAPTAQSGQNLPSGTELTAGGAVRDITFRTDDGEELTRLLRPVQVCFAVTPAQIADAGGADFLRIARFHEGIGWDVLNTSYNFFANEICAYSLLFSVFAVANQAVIPPASCPYPVAKWCRAIR